MRFGSLLGLAVTTGSLLAIQPTLTETSGRTQNTGGTGKTQSQDQKQDTDREIAKYKAMLQKVGPEHRQGREQAIEFLLSIPVLKAHEVIHTYVVPGADPDGVRQAVLGRLPLSLANPRHPAFGNPDKRRLLRRSYLDRLVSHFAPDRKLTKGETAASAARLRSLARGVLLAYGTEELGAGLDVLLAGNVLAVQRATLRAAGECQDMLHAPKIAKFLGKPELADDARAALFDLTYAEFRDQAAFAKWYAANKDRRYLELAEQAARNAKAFADARIGELTQKHLAMVVKHMEVLATSSRAGKWKRIHAEVFPKNPADQSIDVTRACLGKLRDVLAAGGPLVAGPDAADRLLLFDAVSKRIGDSPMVTDHALLLEVASYLCAPTETRRYGEQRARLLAGLDHASVEVQLAALRGLRRFFSPATRARVLQHIAKARGTKDAVTVGTGVATLRSAGWTAPGPKDSDLKLWLDGMRALLRDGSLPQAVRDDATQVLCLSDKAGNKVGEAFDALLAEVKRADAPVGLRRRVMMRLGQFLPADPKALAATARRLLDLLVSLQDDKVDVEIRVAAATLLQLPPRIAKEQALEIGNKLVLDVGARLRVERDERVFTQLVTVMKALADRDESLVAVVNSRMRVALENLGDSVPLLTKELVEGLRVVAVKKGRAVVEWTATCECLVDQRDRTTVRLILAHHMPQGGDEIKTAKKELQHRVWAVVVKAAALAPASHNWSDRANRAEAEMVKRAVTALLAGKVFATTKGVDTPRNRLTFLRCLDATGAAAELITHATRWLSPADKVLTGHDRSAARLLLAKGYLARSLPADAWSKTQLHTIKNGQLEPRLALQMQIATTLHQQNKAKNATVMKLCQVILADALANTKKDTQAYWARLRQSILIRHEQDAKLASSLLQEITVWQGTTSYALTSDEQKQLLALKNRLNGKPGGPSKPGK